MSLVDRFKGEAGERHLTQALVRQPCIRGNEGLAHSLAVASTLRSFVAGEQLISEGGTDNHLLFLLAGSVDIQVRGTSLATRKAGDHVGEMALIEPSLPRSATVIACEEVAAAQVSEGDFVRIADEYPFAWRELASVLTRRLHERGHLLRMPNSLPKLFIGSSSEALPVAQAVELALAHDELETRVWTRGVFGASEYPIDSLTQLVEESDFALLVMAADDTTRSRGRQSATPRDNVVFELGLFMGALGRERTMMLVPRTPEVQIPSDLLGLTPLTYETGGDIDSSLAPVCTQMRRHIMKHGVR